MRAREREAPARATASRGLSAIVSAPASRRWRRGPRLILVAAALSGAGWWLDSAAGPAAIPAAAAATPPAATPAAGTRAAGTPTAATPTTVAPSATTVAPTSGSTLVPIGSQLPAPPVTLPLTTKPESSHVDPLLAKLSLAGFALVIVLLFVQTILTRPRRRKRRWTL
jgi:hypothetical protein